MDFELTIWRDTFHQQWRCEEANVQIPVSGSIHRPAPMRCNSETNAVPFVDESTDERIAIHCDGMHAVVEGHGIPLELVWDEQSLECGASTSVSLPVMIRSGELLVELRRAERLMSPPRSLQSMGCGETSHRGPLPLVPPGLLGQAPSSETLAGWFEALSRLQRSAAAPAEFIQQAAAAVCEPGGLDGGMILLQQGGQLVTAASYFRDPGLGIAFCRDLVQRTIELGMTLFDDEPQSATGRIPVDANVAAPVFGSDDQIVGVVFGRRFLRGTNQRCHIRPLEALWVQLVADATGAALQRADAESRATRTRVLLEQTFSHELANELLHDPTVLEGQEREITVLFCDIRDSTEVGEQLGPRLTYELLSEVLEYLTRRIMEHGGVIIDYYGDGLAAMWNAPRDQADHALRACHAAVAMVSEINQLNARWSHHLNQPLRVGVGIHAGVAQVGNSGTSRRFKYGPRGKVVSVASRLEQATRQVGVPILISKQVSALLDGQAVTRRVCQAKLHGIAEPVELIELHGLDPIVAGAVFAERLVVYGEALACVEAGDLQHAEQLFRQCEAQFGDAPSRLLGRHTRRLADRKEIDRRIVDLTDTRYLNRCGE
jgi:class 3 adenylate cyclase